MTKLIASLISLLLLNFVFLGPSLAKAQGAAASRESSIGRLVVPVFKARTSNKGLEKFWNNHKLDIQKTFIKFFNAKASFEAVASPQEFGFDTSLKTVVLDARKYKGDGVLIGEFLGQSFDFQIRSTVTGRMLAKMSAPIPDSNTTVTEVVSAAVNGLIASFNYDAFVLAVHKNQAKINAGKNQGVKVGDVFQIFDFDSSNPSFSSPVHKLGTLKITQVADFGSIGVISDNSGQVGQYSKVVRAKDNANANPNVNGDGGNIPDLQPLPTAKNTEAKPVTAESPSNSNRSSNSDKVPYKVSPHFYLAPGLSFFSINTSVPSSAPVSAQLRSLQAPFSPGFDMLLGISRLTVDLMISSLSNSSNTVSLLQGNGLFQFYTATFTASALMSSVGLYYSNYNVTPATNPTTLLITSTAIAPELEESYALILSPRTTILAGLDLYLPVMTSDAQNGASGGGSLGYGLDLSWRTNFSQHLGLNVGLRGHFFNIQTAGVAISETEYIMSSHFFYLF